jgi:hypothetical protein
MPDCCLRYHGIEVFGAGGVVSTSSDAWLDGSVVTGAVDCMASLVLVRDAVPSSRNANSGSSAIGSSLFFAVNVLVLNAHRDGFLGAPLALREPRCTKPLRGAFEDLPADFWHALQTNLDEAARERYISNRIGGMVRRRLCRALNFLRCVGE